MGTKSREVIRGGTIMGAKVLLGRLSIEIDWGMILPLDEGSTMVAERVCS
jgi:hypothetical protein